MPAAPEGVIWPVSVHSAHRYLQTTCEHASNLLNLHNGDVARLEIAKGTLETECLTTLEHLETLGLPANYVTWVLEYLGDTVVGLENMIEQLKDRYCLATYIRKK